NQTIHYLDLLQWLVGKPSKLQGWISTLLHRIEVEDIASSTIIFENGAHGILQVSTIDAPPMVRFEISGSKGKIINEDNEIMLSTLEKPINEYIQEETVWGGARFEWKKVRPKVVNPSGHIAVVKNFARAIIEEREPMVPGIEGRVSLEIVNAIILSNFEGKPVKFPINREKYSRLMEKLKGRHTRNTDEELKGI
ncbi:MAG: Gfo/Idh/MocA family protein, partial [Candidatus Bathyarchaeia archaeon]